MAGSDDPAYGPADIAMKVEVRAYFLRFYSSFLQKNRMF